MNYTLSVCLSSVSPMHFYKWKHTALESPQSAYCLNDKSSVCLSSRLHPLPSLLLHSPVIHPSVYDMTRCTWTQKLSVVSLI